MKKITFLFSTLFLSILLSANSLSAQCVPSFTWSETSAGVISFVFASNNCPAPVNAVWTMGDGSSATGLNPVHTYTSSGAYAVCCIVGDSVNQYTFCDSIYVNGGALGCTIAATMSTTPASCPACMDGTATVSFTGAVGNVTFSWSDSSSSGATDFHLASGTVSCCVTDANGCTACADATVGAQGNSNSCSADFSLVADSLTAQTYWIIPVLTGTAPFTCTWSWGDGASSTGMYPTHTYNGAGSYAICVDAIDADSCVSHFCGTFSLQRSATSGPINVAVVSTMNDIQNTSPLGGIELYPNPVSNMFTLSLNGLAIPAGGLEFSMFDQQGKKVISWNQTAQQMNIERQGLANGIYFVKTLVNGAAWSRKVVIN